MLFKNEKENAHDHTFLDSIRERFSPSPSAGTIEIKEEYLEDWPAHYYEIRDINVRESCLKKYLEKHPDSGADKERLEILGRRFGRRAMAERGDRFIKSYMMILVSYQNNFHSFDILKREKELKKGLKELCVLDADGFSEDILRAEWEDFADVYLSTCSSHSYRSTLFGIVTLKDEVVADKIASEIDTVTRLAPGQFNLEAECSGLREILVKAYISRLANGEACWNAYMSKHHDE